MVMGRPKIKALGKYDAGYSRQYNLERDQKTVSIRLKIEDLEIFNNLKESLNFTASQLLSHLLKKEATKKTLNKK